ncbi:MAG: transcription-repair coupling factor [Candidatus Fermentibacteraceae bacterium]
MSAERSWAGDPRLWDQVFERMLSLLAERTLVRVGGLGGASRSLAAASAHRLAGPTIVLAASVSDAESVRDDLASILGEGVQYFPPYETLPWEGEPAHQGVVSDRVECMAALLSGRAGEVVVVPAAGLLKRIPPPDEMSILEVRRGMRITLDELDGWLLAAGYDREEAVYEQGRCSRRGGIVDVGTFGLENPVRIELFGDEVDSIRLFDQRSQRSISEVQSVRLLPAREAFLPPDHWNRAMERVPEEHPLSERLWRSTGFPGLEHYLPLFYGRPLATLFDYLPSIGTLVVMEPALVEERLRESWDFRMGEVPSDSVPFGGEELYAGPDEVLRQMEEAPRRLVMELTPEEDVDVYCHTLPQGSFVGHREEMLRQFGAWLQEGYRLAVACDSPAERESFLELLPEGMEVDAVVLSLSEGFRMPDRGLAVLVERKLLSGRRRPERIRRFRGGEILTSYDDLEPGMLVVHADYGIGVFRGLERISTAGQELDCLAIEYADSDRLLVPMSEIGDVQKYMTPGEHRPKLDRIGGTSWRGRVSRARKKAHEIAGRLAILYAERKASEREPLYPATRRMSSLEETFPYEETPDQMKAIESVKEDLDSGEPMDRLVCGDVGYGKTEVAIRAAFRVVDAGKQVAVLVPTTVLAEQHYNTFRDRLAEFPVRMELLSRFQSRSEQREILEGLTQGDVDLVVGTHRLIQRDVRFSDLGLVIVDEEHRFGVRQKEYLRELRTSVDTLSMTATPIPRTLHMSLSGFRDISIIASPPRDRYPVQTELIRFNRDIIRRAVARELERDGQIFFVHNRIRSIDRVRRRLESFLGDVSIAVAHGQMKASQLERIMHEFVSGEHEILLCTSIIESGLDMPRVNTIFIDNAHMFGLAELYQLRGRVGRSHRRAYCYLIRPGGARKLRPEARNRLQTIKRYTELGAGWHIAMRDLEIRGAGELLGSSQHGHMQSIGYAMFESLIGEEVARLKQGHLRRPKGVRVELPGKAFIPADYMPDLVERVRLYRSVWRAEDEDDVDQWLEMVQDRFGEPPEAVLGCAGRSRVHLLAESAGVEEVVASSGELRLVVSAEGPGLRRLSRELGAAAEVRPERTGRKVCRVKVPPGAEPGEVVDSAVSVLHILSELAIKTD